MTQKFLWLSEKIHVTFESLNKGYSPPSSAAGMCLSSSLPVLGYIQENLISFFFEIFCDCLIDKITQEKFESVADAVSTATTALQEFVENLYLKMSGTSE